VTGIFAEWQPRYAKHRVATFPVENKRPRIRHWHKVGLKGSSQLALKFPEADAFGFQCGKANGITLIDIDSRDERIVQEAIKLFGESPILWRTGSGNHAMPFRYNGEARHIRAVPELSIDVLGGGLAVAPPSMGSTGRYEFLKGGLPDLDRLLSRAVSKLSSPKLKGRPLTKSAKASGITPYSTTLLSKHPMSMTWTPSLMWCAPATWIASRHFLMRRSSASQLQRGATKRREETSLGEDTPWSLTTARLTL